MTSAEDVAVSLGDARPEGVDFSRYELPVCLTDTTCLNDVESTETIVALATSAIANIKSQLAAEKGVEQAMAIAKLGRGKGKGKAIATYSSRTQSMALNEAGLEDGLEADLRRPPQHFMFHIRRKLQRLMGETKGETSAAGALRSKSSASLVSTSGQTGEGESLHPKPPASQKGVSGGLPGFFYLHKKPSGSLVECVSCFEDVEPKNGVKTVCHTYCKGCFKSLVQTAVKSDIRWPPRCCLNPVPPRTITKNISGRLLKEYKAKAEEHQVPVKDRLYCSEPDCGEWLRKVDRAKKRARCPRGHQMCTMCRQPAHPSGTACPQDRSQQLADELAALEGWARCTRCQVLVEHQDGCQHMTCRCGAEFCYLCRAKWRSCYCTMAQLANFKLFCKQRHDERVAQMAEEEAWMANAMRLVEESVAAEQLATEEQRLQVEREREKREGVRLADLDVKYAKLHSALSWLNGCQRTQLEVTQYTERSLGMLGAGEALRGQEMMQGAERNAELWRKHTAELKWLDLVTAERGRLLTELETVERESGESA